MPGNFYVNLENHIFCAVKVMQIYTFGPKVAEERRKACFHLDFELYGLKISVQQFVQIKWQKNEERDDEIFNPLKLKILFLN